jgi:hypothetical protein
MKTKPRSQWYLPDDEDAEKLRARARELGVDLRGYTYGWNKVKHRGEDHRAR